jgi:hypothetical protein
MNGSAKSRPKSDAGGAYAQRGWKNVRSSAASSVFVSPLPARVRNRMITVSKEKKILATGGVFAGFFPRTNTA